ncbi:MAG: hypothetical protein K6U14_09100 [Firmicutes bacterium]|nr:hypothetical protein [Alicyclobacillaceae bacterium]MCL6497768.1 hypothetical protein [Bacillota bacterium]
MTVTGLRHPRRWWAAAGAAGLLGLIAAPPVRAAGPAPPTAVLITAQPGAALWTVGSTGIQEFNGEFTEGYEAPGACTATCAIDAQVDLHSGALAFVDGWTGSGSVPGTDSAAGSSTPIGTVTPPTSVAAAGLASSAAVAPRPADATTSYQYTLQASASAALVGQSVTLTTQVTSPNAFSLWTGAPYTIVDTTTGQTVAQCSAGACSATVTATTPGAQTYQAFGGQLALSAPVTVTWYPLPYTLQATTSQTVVGQSVTLSTSVSSQSYLAAWTLGPYAIVDTTTGQTVAQCSPGPCSATVTASTPGAQTYVAETGKTQLSPPVTVTWVAAAVPVSPPPGIGPVTAGQPVSWLTLTASPSHPMLGQPVYLAAAADPVQLDNQLLLKGQYGSFRLQIVNTSTGQVLATCSDSVTCDAYAMQPGGTATFIAELSAEAVQGGAVATVTSSPVSVSWSLPELLPAPGSGTQSGPQTNASSPTQPQSSGASGASGCDLTVGPGQVLVIGLTPLPACPGGTPTITVEAGGVVWILSALPDGVPASSGAQGGGADIVGTPNAVCGPSGGGPACQACLSAGTAGSGGEGLLKESGGCEATFSTNAAGGGGGAGIALGGAGGKVAGPTG